MPTPSQNVRSDDEVRDARYAARDPRNAALVDEAEKLWWQSKKEHAGNEQAGNDNIKMPQGPRDQAQAIGAILVERGYKTAGDAEIGEVIYECFLDKGIFLGVKDAAELEKMENNHE